MKQHYTDTKKISGLSLMTILFITLVFNSSCTKEIENWIDKKAATINDTLRTLPANRIIEYKVANINDEPIYSAVNDSLKTITVYLPAYYQLSIIQPEIKLPAGTTIQPSADEPVSVFSDQPVEYQVKASNGKTSSYKLNIIVQQEDFTLNELSSTNDPEKLTVIRESNNGNIIITGSNFLPNYVITNAYLLDEDGKELYKLLPNGNSEPAHNSLAYNYGTFYNLDVPTGTYWIEVRSYAIKKRMRYPVIIERYHR